MRTLLTCGVFAKSPPCSSISGGFSSWFTSAVLSSDAKFGVDTAENEPYYFEISSSREFEFELLTYEPLIRNPGDPPIRVLLLGHARAPQAGKAVGPLREERRVDWLVSGRVPVLEAADRAPSKDGWNQQGLPGALPLLRVSARTCRC